MARSFPFGFRVHIPEPVEVKMVSPTIAERDAIHPFERYRGLFTYVISEDAFYYLSNGITNNDWKEIGKPKAIEIFDVFTDQQQTIVSGYALKEFISANYVTTDQLNEAISLVTVPDHVKNITQEQINSWDEKKGDKNIIHVQTNPSMTWVVNHVLGVKPSVQTFLPNNKKIEGDIEHIDNNMLVVRFSRPYTGIVTLN
jgi:hypothetical protein